MNTKKDCCEKCDDVQMVFRRSLKEGGGYPLRFCGNKNCPCHTENKCCIDAIGSYCYKHGHTDSTKKPGIDEYRGERIVYVPENTENIWICREGTTFKITLPVSQEKEPSEEECCHSCSTGGKCEKQDGFVEAALAEFREKFFGQLAWRTSIVEEWLISKLEEAHNISGWRFIEDFEEGERIGRKAERTHILQIIESMNIEGPGSSKLLREFKDSLLEELRKTPRYIP